MELQAAMAAATLADDYFVQFEAVNPNTGGAVSGVLISDATLLVDDQAGEEDNAQLGPFMWVPGPGF